MSAFRYPKKTGAIKSLRVAFHNGDWWEHSSTGGLSDAVALQAARALVPDGWVVARVPDAAPDDYDPANGGWNLCRAAMLAAAQEGNDGP